MGGLSVIATLLAVVSTWTSVGRFTVVAAVLAMGGLSVITTLLTMVSTGTSVRRFTVVTAGFAMRRTAGFTAVTTTAISLPGFTHAFKAFPQCSAFLLAHVAPSLPHGGTP
jgi:hypothetical protein